MDQAKHHALSVPIRNLHECEFTGTDGEVIDAGPGRSFVGYWILVALNSTIGTMTFNGAPPTTELDGETAPTLGPVHKENGDGATREVYTEKPETGLGYFPLKPGVFNGCRWIQPIHADSQTGKKIYPVSKPL